MTLDFFDLAAACGGEVSVVGQRPANAGRIVLVEQQLELFLAAHHVGGFRQRRQRLTFGPERFLFARLLAAQFGSAPLRRCLGGAQAIDLAAL